MNEAAASGHLEILQWLMRQVPLVVWDDRTCAAAAEGGHLHVVQWLRSQKPPCLWSEHACILAVHGHLKVLQWLCSQKPPCPCSEGVSDGACYLAAGSGHLHILQWLRSQSPPHPWGHFSLIKARRHWHDDVLGWALLHGCPTQQPFLFLRRQLVFLTCVAHQQKSVVGNTPGCRLGQCVLKLPSDVIQHIATLM